jgi:hypothetical protein
VAQATGTPHRLVRAPECIKPLMKDVRPGRLELWHVNLSEGGPAVNRPSGVDLTCGLCHRNSADCAVRRIDALSRNTPFRCGCLPSFDLERDRSAFLDRRWPSRTR